MKRVWLPGILALAVLLTTTGFPPTVAADGIAPAWAEPDSPFELEGPGPRLAPTTPDALTAPGLAPAGRVASGTSIEAPQQSQQTVRGTNVDQEASPFGAAEIARTPIGTRFSNHKPVLDEAGGYLYFWHSNSVLHIYDLDLNLVASPEFERIDYIVPSGDDLFVSAGFEILRYSLPDLTLVDTITRESVMTGDEQAITGGRLWYATYPQGRSQLHSYDLDTRETVVHPVSASAQGVWVGRLRAAPGAPDRLLTHSGLVLDVSGPEITAIGQTIQGHLISISDDGRFFYGGGHGDDSVYEYSMATGELVRTMPTEHGFGYFHVVAGQNVAFNSTGDSFSAWDTITGQRIGKFANAPIVTIRALSDLSRAFVFTRTGGHLDLVLVSLAPHISATDKAIYRPDLSTQLQVDGLLLGPDVTVEINGQVAPHQFRFQKSVLSIQLDPTDTGSDGVIVLRSPLGETTHVLPGTPPRGTAVVALHLDADLTPAQVEHLLLTREVECDSPQGRVTHEAVWMRDTVATVRVPTHQTCRIYEVSGQRLGFLPTDGPYLPVPDPLVEAEFVSGGVVHLGVRIEPAVLPLWVYSSVVGGTAQPAQQLRVEVDCAGQVDVVTLDGDGAQRLTYSGPIAAELRDNNARCNATAVGFPAATVTVTTAKVANVDGRDFEASFEFPDYLSFRVDLGGSDPWAVNVVGVPGEGIGPRAGAGAVQLLPTDTGANIDGLASSLYWQGRGGLFGAPEAGDRFGASVARGDFNNDGWTDIAIGAPGEGLGPRDNAGMVTILFGASSGFSAQRSTYLHQDVPGVPGVGEAGDRFGEALAVVDYDGDFVDDLVVGVPGEGIGPLDDAGLVHVFYGSSAGLAGVGSEVITQGTPGIFGAVEAGDEFGAALAGRLSYLVIGSPGEDIGAVEDAGLIHYLDGLTYTSSPVWNSGGAAYPPEPGGRFGSVLEMTDNHLIVGMPLADVSGVVDAGRMFTFWRPPGTVTLGHADHFEQSGLDFAIIEQTVESNDHFGASLSAREFSDGTFLLIGVPGEDANRGYVHLVKLEGSFRSEDWNFWSQDAIGFTGEPGDRFGESVTFGYRGSIVATAPGEDDGAGALFVTAGAPEWARFNQGSGGLEGAPEPGDGFGGTVG